MSHLFLYRTAVLVFVTVIPIISLASAAEDPRELMAKYVLETVKAFRTVYGKQVIEDAQKGGIKPGENWSKDDHAIMLPAQFVKAAGNEIKEFELGLISLNPIYKSNLPKTDAEADALKKLMANPQQQIVSFTDGNQFKAVAADYAIAPSCVSCHNQHPQSAKKDWKQGDLMGAVVVRFKQ